MNKAARRPRNTELDGMSLIGGNVYVHDKSGRFFIDADAQARDIQKHLDKLKKKAEKKERISLTSSQEALLNKLTALAAAQMEDPTYPPSAAAQSRPRSADQ